MGEVYNFKDRYIEAKEKAQEIVSEIISCFDHYAKESCDRPNFKCGKFDYFVFEQQKKISNLIYGIDFDSDWYCKVRDKFKELSEAWQKIRNSENEFVNSVSVELASKFRKERSQSYYNYFNDFYVGKIKKDTQIEEQFRQDVLFEIKTENKFIFNFLNATSFLGMLMNENTACDSWFAFRLSNSPDKADREFLNSEQVRQFIIDALNKVIGHKQFTDIVFLRSKDKE